MNAQSQSDSAPSSYGLIKGRNWFILFVTVVGIGMPALEVERPGRFLLSTVPLGLAYLVLTVGLGDRLTQGKAGRRLAWIYFALQLALMTFLAYVFLQFRAFSALWLLFMPLISQARMVLPAIGTLLVNLASMGIIIAHLAALAGWNQVLNSVPGISTAMVFVLLFTEVAMRETDARKVSQALSDRLEAANRRLSEYAVQAEELATARERTRMAREIHDSLGHSLTAVHMQLEAARTILDHDAEKAKSALSKAQRCVKEGLSEIRSSVSSLRNDPLEGRGLPQALNDLVDSSTGAGTAAVLRLRGSQRPLSNAVSLALFRSAQEALTNARKYARASKVELVLDFGKHPSRQIELTVSDNGIGCDVETLEARAQADHGAGEQGGFGLIGLRERARQLKGSLDIESRPGEGFKLHVALPTTGLGSAASGPGEDGTEPHSSNAGAGSAAAPTRPARAHQESA